MKQAETAKRHYQAQLETLHGLIWAMDCYHVNQFNRSNNEVINWGDCGYLDHVISKLQELVDEVNGRGV